MAFQYALALGLSALTTAGGLAPWHTGTPMPIPSGGHSAASVGREVLVAGGTTWHHGMKQWLREIFAYDPASDHWSTVGLLPEPVGDDVGMGAADALYLVGGSDGKAASSHCYRLRLDAGRLATDRLVDLPAARVYAAGARIGRHLYVVGGGTDPDRLATATTTLFALDLDRPEDGWRSLRSLPGPARVTHAAAASGPFLYVFGGCYLDEQRIVRNLADAYRYDTRADQWERLPDAPRANRAWTATDDGAGGVLLFGGFTASEEECQGKGDDFGFTAEVLRYDIKARTYSEWGELPRATASTAPVRMGRDLILLGGEPVKRQRGDWVWRTSLPRGGNDRMHRPVSEPESQVVVPNTSEHPRNGEADIVALRNGDLLLGYGRWNRDGDDFGAAEIWSKTSHDGGATWGEDRVLVSNEGKVTTFEVGFLRLRSGALLMTYCVKDSKEDCSVCFRQSTDEGHTWGDRARYSIPAPYTGYTGINNNRLIQLRSGRVLLVAYDGWVRGRVILSFALYSDDEGRTWHKSTDVDVRDIVPGDQYGADEPAVIELKDGRVLMIFRTDAGFIGKSYSADRGATWSKPEPIKGVVAPNSPASIARLPRTGDLLLIWNNNKTARNPLNSAISSDEGTTWRNVRIVDRGAASFCYTSITPLKDRALLTYYGRGGLVLRAIPSQWFYEEEAPTSPWVYEGDVREGAPGAEWHLGGNGTLYIQDMPEVWDGAQDSEVEAPIVLRSLSAGKRATAMLWVGDQAAKSSCALYLRAGEQSDAVSFSETMEARYDLGDSGKPHRYRVVTHHKTASAELFVDDGQSPVLSAPLGSILGQYDLNRILYGNPNVDFLGGESDLLGIHWRNDQ